MNSPYFRSSDVTIWHADSRTAWRDLPEHTADAIVTSPPYFGLRDYGHDEQIGLEANPTEYIDTLADLLTGYGERVMKPGGSLWLNLGDSYNGPQTGHKDDAGVNGGRGLPPYQAGNGASREQGFPLKCLLMIPERVALALIARGWILRNKVIWAKPNGMPSSVQDRLATKHEAMFHFVRQPRYYYDLDAIREPHKMSSWSAKADVEGRSLRSKRSDRASIARDGEGISGQGRPPDAMYHEGGKNPGDWWVIPTQPYPDAHFAVFPQELVRRPILATVPEHVCRSCGTERTRVTEKGDRVLANGRDGEPHSTEYGRKTRDRIDDRAAEPASTGAGFASRERTTVGWSDCGCGAGWTAGTVLDPFFGSGTTAVMARRLGRKAVGVELSADYCALAAARFRQDVLDFG